MASTRTWCNYLPYIYFNANPPNFRMLWTIIESIPVILYQRKFKEKLHYDIFNFPVGADPAQLSYIIDYLDTLNGDNTGRIMWFSEDELPIVKSIPETQIQFKDKEYIYEISQTASAVGHEFAHIRKRCNRFERENLFYEWRSMTADDIPDCLELLERWMSNYREQSESMRLFDYGYTKRTLEGFGAFDKPDVMSWILCIRGNIAAFAMAGEMYGTLANFYILKTDRSILGLSEFARRKVFIALHKKGYSVLNDASDLGHPGLRRHKMKFRPVELLNTYQLIRKK